MAETVTHIAAIVPYNIYPAKMGGQKAISLFYQYLAEQLPVSLISTDNNEEPKGSLVELLPVLGHSKWRYINPALFFRLRNIIREKKISHLIIEHPYYGWLGILLKWRCKVKLIVRSHNIEAIRFKSIGKWWWGILWHYEKMIHRNADLNFFIQDDDRQYGITRFKLAQEKCFNITYGFGLRTPPSNEERLAARNWLCSNYAIDKGAHILLFNGTLDYKPNLDAVDGILEKINPYLLEKKAYPYKIIICGMNLPARYNRLESFRDKHIIYAGFVEDIGIFYKGADIFINPVIDGGGIKTKLVEALGNNLTVVSSQSGAIGIPAGITGDKMKIVADNDLDSFAEQICNTSTSTMIPAVFFDHFYWGNIAGKAASLLK